MIEVSQLTIYPVKSASGNPVLSMPITRLGPQWDRRWMLVDSSGKFLTQRQLPRMCLIQAIAGQEGLTIRLPDDTALLLGAVPSDKIADKVVTVWGDQVDAIDCGDEVAGMCSAFLQKQCRLVFMPDASKRLVDPEYARAHELVSFADGFPLLLLSEASLEDLNSRLNSPVPMSRFRPNIVVRGCDAFAEDGWSKITIDDLTLSLVKPCSRCIIPAIDSSTGLKNSEIIRVMASYRRRDDGAVYFGQNLLSSGQGIINIGAEVCVVE